MMFLDLTMPEMDGFEVLENIRKRSQKRGDCHIGRYSAPSAGPGDGFRGFGFY